MTPYVYEIKGAPVAWASHKGNGKRSYNPHRKEKIQSMWQLKIQHGKRPLFTGAVRVDFFFHVPIPKNIGKTILQQLKAGKIVYCTKRPDCTNYRKHAEDCLTGTVLQDDNLVVAGETRKTYTLGEPKTVIVVQEIYATQERKEQEGDRSEHKRDGRKRAPKKTSHSSSTRNSKKSRGKNSKTKE